MGKGATPESIVRACSSKEMKLLMKQAMRNVPWKRTRKGILFYADNGTIVGTHFTNSDHRALKNFRMELIKAGIIEREK